jgi:hypothetical protein
VIAVFELNAIDSLGEPMSNNAPEQFLGLWNFDIDERIAVERRLTGVPPVNQ